MILLPTLIFLQNLVAHVVCLCAWPEPPLPVGSGAKGTAAHEVWPRYHSGVSAGVKLGAAIVMIGNLTLAAPCQGRT